MSSTPFPHLEGGEGGSGLMQVPALLVVLLFLIWLKRLLEETWQLWRLCHCPCIKLRRLCHCHCPRRIKTDGTAKAESDKTGGTAEAESDKTGGTAKAESDTASRWNCHAFFVFLAVNGSFHAFLDWVYLAISGGSLYFLWSFEPYPLRRSLDRIREKLGAYTSTSNRP